MPRQVIARFAVVVSVLVGVLALCGLTVQAMRELGESVDATVGRIECTDADYQLAEQLARDPVLTAPPPGAVVVRTDHHAPCEADSSQWGLATAIISLPAGTSTEQVIDHYRAALTAGHWRIVPGSAPEDRLCADRVTNGQQVRLLLVYGRSPPGPHTDGEIAIEISFLPGGEDLRCHS